MDPDKKEPTAADLLRLHLAEAMTPNERAAEHLREALEKRRAAKEKKLHEEFNADVRSLEILTQLYPEVPITAPVPFPFAIAGRRYMLLEDGTTLWPISENTFGTRVEGTMYEYTFVPEREEIQLVNTRNDLINRHHYFGKLVVVAPEGGEASETDELITLPPCPPGLNEGEYLNNLYRDRHLVVRSLLPKLREREKDHFSSLYHFQGVPWKLKERREGAFTNLIFKNLHTDVTRRYIIRGERLDCFMLEGEIFTSVETGLDGNTKIIRCSSGKVAFRGDPSTGFYIDCNGYAVTIMKNVFGQETISILNAVPIPAPVE